MRLVKYLYLLPIVFVLATYVLISNGYRLVDSRYGITSPGWSISAKQ